MDDEKTTIKWLGHAAFEVKTGEAAVYIDPWLEGNPLAAVKKADVTECDIILVTHDHFDHVGDAVEIAKRTGAVVVAQPETAEKLKTQSNLSEKNIVNGGMGIGIGGTVEIKRVKVTAVQAHHTSATGVATGYIIKTPDGKTIYHAGDTGVFGDMELISRMYPIDVALLPIGGCFTMDSEQAAETLTLLKPKVVIPMHYKTFPVLEQEAENFLRLARDKAPETVVKVLNPGEAYTV